MMSPEILARYDARIPRYTSYPTAPHFSPAITGADYAAWLGALDPALPVSLYLHVPFCAVLCLYCGCHTTVTRSYVPVEHYVEGLLAEIDLVADRLPGRLSASHIHFGGGTPSILSERDFPRIMERLRARFDLGGEAEIAIEIDPRTLSEPKAALLGELGFTRASLGVQDFEEIVQRTVNRIQSYETTAAVAGWLRRAGIGGINLDLMYGLPHQTVASVEATADRALGLDPDRVALFGYAHVPWMKKQQALLPEAALPDGPQRFAQAAASAASLEAAGYRRIGLDHFAKPDDPMAVGLETGTLHRNFQGYTTDAAPALIGFGASSIGSLPQGYVQNIAATPAWRDAVARGVLPTARGIALSAEDRMRRAIIEELMCTLAVDPPAIARAHGIAEAFVREWDALRAMEADGLVLRSGTSIRVPEPARPLVRAVAAVFDRYLEASAGRHARAV